MLLPQVYHVSKTTFFARGILVDHMVPRSPPVNHVVSKTTFFAHGILVDRMVPRSPPVNYVVSTYSAHWVNTTKLLMFSTPGDNEIFLLKL